MKRDVALCVGLVLLAMALAVVIRSCNPDALCDGDVRGVAGFSLCGRW